MAARTHARQFVREGRSYNTAAASVSNSNDSPEIDVIRQRARRAAEFYHQSLGGVADDRGMDVDASFHSDPSGDPYRGPPRDSRNGGTNSVMSEAYYPQNMRAGFIDLRNSYNEKRKTKFTAYPSRGTGPPDQYGYNAHGDPHPAKDRSRSQERKLYRSNSSLELEHLEEDRSHIHRDYGSTSSLDVVGDGTGGNDTFFQMLQDYRNENPTDQRAPPPPQIHDVLRGTTSRPQPRGYTPNQTVHHNPLSHKLSNGAIPIEEDPTSGDGSQSPKPKHKSLKNKDRKQRAKTVVAESSGGGLFRKKRIHKSESDSTVKSLESSSDSDIRNDERQKRKLLIHYDCQSICVNLSELLQKRNAETADEVRRKNMTTGASAASLRNPSGIDTQVPDSDEPDPGDRNSNDLVLSCPYFRNELGGEEERFVALNIVTAQKRLQKLMGQHRTVDTRTLMRPPACNGVSVLDMSVGPHGYVPIPLLTHDGLVFEYVDQGAYYYRNFFNGMDHQNFCGIDDSLGPVSISLKKKKVPTATLR